MSPCLIELLGAESFFPLRKTPAAATITLVTGFPPQQVLSNKNIKIKQRKAKHVSKKNFIFFRGSVNQSHLSFNETIE
jgi:hypothetical protein